MAKRAAANAGNQSYPGLGQLDPRTQQAFRFLWDRVNALQGSPDDPGWKSDFHAGNFRLTELGDGTDQQDAVTLSQVLALTDPARFQRALSIGGAAPLNITQLIGGGSNVLTGVYGDLANTAPAGLFYVADATFNIYGLYAAVTVGGSPTWVLMAGNSAGSYAAAPGVLGLNDAGYLFFAQDRGILRYWTGAAWRWQLGTYTDTWANLPNPATLTASTGVFFSASDRGYQLWRFSRVAPDWTFVGGGSPTRDTLANLTGSLTTTDAGYLFYATDYNRTFRWNGSAYENAPGEETQGMMADFKANPGTGWALCDGASVTMSQPDGSTASYTTLDYVTNDPFNRSGNATGTGTFGTTGTDYHFTKASRYVRL